MGRKSTGWKLFMILLGNTMYALAVVWFILPAGLITGGTTGMALAADHFLNIPIGSFVAVFNIAMFFLGFWALGKAFAVTTVLSSFYYPFVLNLFQRIFDGFVMTEEPVLATVFAGLFIGAGMGLVIRAGASTGGMDIPPLVLHKKLGLSVSVVMYGFDVAILGLQMLFSDREQILYGMLLVLIYTVVLDKVLVIGSQQTQVKIISEKYEEINRAIQSQLDRGSTLLEIEGGYLRQEGYTVLTVLSGRELPRLNEIVMNIDPKAFLIINKVNEVRGRGFTMGKEYR